MDQTKHILSFDSGGSAHSFAKKVSSDGSGRPVEVYKVIKNNYDLDLDHDDRPHGIIRTWLYSPTRPKKSVGNQIKRTIKNKVQKTNHTIRIKRPLTHKKKKR